MSEEHVATSSVVNQKLAAKDFLIPGSIIVAGIVIGLGLYFSGGTSDKATVAVDEQPVEEVRADTTSKIDPVTEADYIRGNLNAPVKIVEYSDFECPFCKRHHETLETVFAKLGTEKIAWVFRQFPLEQLHPVKAMAVAMASECVGELGGDESFWVFTNRYFEETLTNNRTNIDTLIPKLVTETGVNKQAFNDCVASERHQAAIDADIADAIETGGQGTPWSVMIGPTGKTYPINGAQPASVIEQMVEQAIAEA